MSDKPPESGNKLTSADEKRLLLFDNLEQRLWTYEQLASASSLPITKIQRLVWSGDLVPLRIGRYVRFDPKEAMKRLKELGAGKNVQVQRPLARHVAREWEKKIDDIQRSGQGSAF